MWLGSGGVGILVHGVEACREGTAVHGAGWQAAVGGRLLLQQLCLLNSIGKLLAQVINVVLDALLLVLG